MQEPLLQIRCSASYGERTVLRDVALELRQGEILGLVGQSGSGKSTLALALLGLLKFKGGTIHGSIRWRGREYSQEKEKALRQIRGKEIALVLQNAGSSLNPVLSLQTQFREAWRAHSAQPWQQASAWLSELLHGVDLPSDEAFLKRLPCKISAGQAQRVLIALALLHRPPLLVADEPTSALDPITAHEVLRLLRKLNKQMGTTILCISHDLLSMAAFCQRMAILHQGSIIECGTPREIFCNPREEYTRQLLNAIPQPDFDFVKLPS